jgi:hypothetical protein
MNNQKYKRKLSMVRMADADHEAMMKAAAKKAGVSLFTIRIMEMKNKDVHLLSMFRKARE